MNAWWTRMGNGKREANTLKFWLAGISGAALVGLLVAATAIGYRIGSQTRGPANLREAILHATATHGATNVAVATGQVSEDAEGIFILDYLTGNLQCWVFYPRVQRFGAKFETNITQQLPATKNAEYLMVTGMANTVQVSGNARPAGCLLYVVDAKSGMFAAYALPWNRSAEMSGEMQRGMMLCVGGDQYRIPIGGSSTKKPTIPQPTKEPEKAKTPSK